ncbi:hypothetical protein D3C81_2224840 [compost metagenome]
MSGVAAVTGVLRGLHLHIPRRFRAQVARGLDRGASYFNVLGTLELEVAVG